MKRNQKSLVALSLLASLALVSAQSLAQTAVVTEKNQVNYEALNLQLPVNPSGPGNYYAGSLNIDVNGTTFLAFCIDPSEYSSSSTQLYNVTNSLASLGSTQASAVTNLYSQSYNSTLGSSANSAAFQLALWELAKDNGNLATGSVQKTGSTTSSVVATADNMIYNATHNAPGSGQYSFNLYTNAGYQDYLVASVTAVPEPQTYAMLLAGLGLIGFTASRRRVSK